MLSSRPARPGNKPDRIMPFWYGLLLVALSSLLLPIDPDSAITAPALIDLGLGYVHALSQQLYLLIKAAMLWAPLGLVVGIIGQERTMKRWAPVGLAALLLIGLLLLPDAHIRDGLEIVFAVPGLALGVWLGNKTRGQNGVGVPVSAGAEAIAVSAPLPHPASQEPSPAALPAQGPGFAATIPDAAITSGRKRRQRQTRTSVRAAATTGTRPLSLLFGVAVLALTLLGLWDFPRWPIVFGLALALYTGLLWRRPLAWLVVIPAALPLLDLAPWTGRFFFDEFDLLMLATLGVNLLRPRSPTPPHALPGLPLLLFGLLALSVIVSGAIGLLPLATLDANAFTSYWSPYNSLRLAKGFLWGGLLFLWLRNAQVRRKALARWLTLGMSIGLLGVGVVGTWEHSLFVGFEGRLETYRIFSTFSSMHIGGGHIEAYLVAALPFLWLASARLRDVLVTAPLMALTAYVMLYTVARGGVLAIAVVIVILTVASGRLAMRTLGRRYLAPIGALLAVALVVEAGVGSGYLQKRFSESAQDWQTRVNHWAQSVDMMDGTLQTQLFGMGLGSFPRRYLEQGPADNQPATFGYVSEQGNTYFRLGSGRTVYYAQRIPFEAGHRYRLELDVRTRQANDHLDTPVCEKQLLNSRQCEWFGFDIPGDGQWHRLSREFSSSKVGAESWLRRPPVELFFYHPGKTGVVDIDNVRLIDPEGRNILCNGDFSAGSDCWFFKTHTHLPWHIKNVWMHVWFEQGALGVLAFTGLVLLAVVRLAREAWRGHRLAWAWLASLAGLLTVGLFDSLLDAPRLATLLIALILLGAGYDWREGDQTVPKHRGPS
jgi:hypothetical protein